MARQAVTSHGLRTRTALMDAGTAIAEAHGLAGISVSAVTAEAGVAKGTFYVHFDDRQAFVAALRDAFDERVGSAIRAAVRDAEPGARRLMAGLIGYLDACLADRAIKALLREARGGPGLDALSGDRTGRFVAMVEPNLKAMGWREAAAGARLVVAMVSEVALLEIDAGRKHPGARRALRRFIERADTTADR